MRKLHLIACAVALFPSAALAMNDSDLRAALEQRFKDDRTGACVAAAVIDNGVIASAYVCADTKSQRPYDEHTAFEIGSVTKTMTAALLAEFIARGDVTLDDPLAKLLPKGTRVPAFGDRQITIGDIVTHTSGLPSIPEQWRLSNISNPYAGVTEADLLGALAATQLTRAPGSKWEYSNFAVMVLSYALAKRSGTDYETLLRERLLVPLGMNNTYVTKRPPQVRLTQGHLSNATPAVPWDFPPDMAGVGGVRATLPDMVRYLEAELGTRDSAITPALTQTQRQVARVDGHAMAMTWMLSGVKDRTIVAHEGGTGGYSSFVAFDRAAKRAVVLLSDTSQTSIGDFSVLGRHLLEPAVLVGPARKVAAADSKLVDALVGTYQLESGLRAQLRRKGNALTIQADGQPEFEMGYDSAGDFYPLQFDAVLRPLRKSDGTYALTWFQSGGRFEAARVDSAAAGVGKWTPTEAEIKEYEGNYPLSPAFALRVFSIDAKLFVQGTKQAAIEVVAVEKDAFVAERVGAEFMFARDGDGKVAALTLRQGGKILRGDRK